MSLPLAALTFRSFTPQSLSHGAAKPSAEATQTFAAHAKGLDGEIQTKNERCFRHLPGYGRIETLKVTETTVGPDGKPVSTIKELAICPECGTANCSCLARVTLQSRLDEENAKGPRDKEQPKPYSVLPQTFNQMSANFSSTSQGRSSAYTQGNAPPRMFG